MGDRLKRLHERTNGYTVTPRQCAIAAYVALGALSVIVLTGAAVRLTGSGLGCPRWPRCYGGYYPPLSTHAVIEFSNRLITGPVSIAAGCAWLAALRRRPYRRDLTWIAALLPLGVVAQAVLGGFTVQGRLDYGWVMGHFALSMLILLAASALAWRAGGWTLGREGRTEELAGRTEELAGRTEEQEERTEGMRVDSSLEGPAAHAPAYARGEDARIVGSLGGPAARAPAYARGGEARVDGSLEGPAARARGLGPIPAHARAADRTIAIAARALAALGALTIFAGTAATAAGPHAGGSPGQRINRLSFDGRGTMDFVIHRHAEIALAFGVGAVGLWWLARRRGADVVVRRAATALCVLIALQGAVGLDQYETHLPTELVWVHVALATAAWLAALWTAYAAGPLRAPAAQEGGHAGSEDAAGAGDECAADAARDTVLAGR